MRCPLRNSFTKFDLSALVVMGCLTVAFPGFGRSSNVPDTCGDYFFLPTFPECDLYLEAVRCSNNSHTVIVTMATPSGEFLHSFEPSLGESSEQSLRLISKNKYPGIIVRSNEDISVYVHKELGDSMTVFPVDALARTYEIPRLAPPTNVDALARAAYETPRLAPPTGPGSKATATLFVFTPFNNTSIAVTTLRDIDGAAATTSPTSSPTPLSSSSSSSTSMVLLDAFEISKYIINPQLRYRLSSTDVFGVILVQSKDPPLQNDSSCKNISLLDFVPPYSVRGSQFYIAFPNITDFTMFIQGSPNDTVDITTDLMFTEFVLDQSGSSIRDVTRTTSAWVSATHDVSIYVKLTICSNASTPPRLCADNGFFLPSVDHYFTCQGNKSRGGCVCTCPSVFQRTFDPETFAFFQNASDAQPTSAAYPLMVRAIFDISTYIQPAFEFKEADDVIITTNNSFIVFRYDLTNLNFLPSGSKLPVTSCSQNMDVLFQDCRESKGDKSGESSDDAGDNPNSCPCEFVLDEMFSFGGDKSSSLFSPPSSGNNVGPIEYWEDEAEDTTRPLIAVVVSLCVAIFAVIALISGYMLVEMMSRRKHVRNTKIRPFVS